MINLSTEIYKALSLGSSIDYLICNVIKEQLNLILKSE